MQNIVEHAFEVIFFPWENFVVHANRNHPDPSLAGAWEWRTSRDGSTAWKPSRELDGKAEVTLHGGGHSATLGALLRGKMRDGRWEERLMSGHTTLRGLYAITDTLLIPRDRFVATVKAAVRGGATLVQLREKETPRAEIVRLGRAVLEVTRRYGA